MEQGFLRTLSTLISLSGQDRHGHLSGWNILGLEHESAMAMLLPRSMRAACLQLVGADIRAK